MVHGGHGGPPANLAESPAMTSEVRMVTVLSETALRLVLGELDEPGVSIEEAYAKAWRTVARGPGSNPLCNYAGFAGMDGWREPHPGGENALPSKARPGRWDRYVEGPTGDAKLDVWAVDSYQLRVLAAWSPASDNSLPERDSDGWCELEVSLFGYVHDRMGLGSDFSAALHLIERSDEAYVCEVNINDLSFITSIDENKYEEWLDRWDDAARVAWEARQQRAPTERGDWTEFQDGAMVVNQGPIIMMVGLKDNFYYGVKTGTKYELIRTYCNSDTDEHHCVVRGPDGEVVDAPDVLFHPPREVDTMRPQDLRWGSPPPVSEKPRELEWDIDELTNPEIMP